MTRSDAQHDEWAKNLPEKLEAFVQNWRAFNGLEDSGAQTFLNALLSIYEAKFKPGEIFQQHPVRIASTAAKQAQADLFGPRVPQYTSERMDMYLPKLCVWEQKAPGEKDLAKHHDQVLRYWSRMRTRYMVLCNFREFWIFDTELENGHIEPAVKFSLKELPARGDALLFLRGEQPDLQERRSEGVTADVAQRLGQLQRALIEATSGSAEDRERIAKFVLECVFAMFAEDTELLPKDLFTNTLRVAEKNGQMDSIWSLFDDFGRRDRKGKGNVLAPYVNGPLFDREHPKLTLSADQLRVLYVAARDFDWQAVRPEIFGFIFEQAFAASDRHELGAHFTREEDIARVVIPTVVDPWRQRVAAIKSAKACAQVIEELRAFHVLDPACGSGNFLYVAYREMKRIEAALVELWDKIQHGTAPNKKARKPAPPRPYFTLAQVHGIEKDETATLLARVVLWFGEHLANRELGTDEEILPLKNLDATIQHGDALFVDWPRPEGELAIVGNPPYLGVRKMRHELGDAYVEKLFERFPDNRAADLVTYWFPRALEVLRKGERAGFVCTNSIAQNESREASIDKVIAKGGTLVDAWKSLVWPGDAAVHFSIVSWIMGDYDGVKILDGKEVTAISPGLTGSIDVTRAAKLWRNLDLCFMGVTPGNSGFVLSAEERETILAADPDSAPVIKPLLVGMDVNREIDQRPTRYIIDFGAMEKEEAEGYTGAMRHVRRHVYPVQKNNRRETYAQHWWRFVEARVGLREAIEGQSFVLVIPRVSPHLIVCRQPNTSCFDGQLMVVALNRYYHFGVLQSAVHEAWVLAQCSTLEERIRYTNTTCFETFPFPTAPKGNYAPSKVPISPAATKLEATAKAFSDLRAKICVERGLGLTKVHNLLVAGELPVLTAAYDAMNDAVCDGYGWPTGTWRDRDETLELLITRNRELAWKG